MLLLKLLQISTGLIVAEAVKSYRNAIRKFTQVTELKHICFIALYFISLPNMHLITETENHHTVDSFNS